jgi:hypothetical protein
VAATLGAIVGGAAFADDEERDFGLRVERQLSARSEKLFGIDRPLEESAPPTTGAYRTPDQTAADQVVLARGLRVEYLTRDAGELTDMMAFFPADRPTHLVTCVETGRSRLPDGRLNPSVQRIDLATGEVRTVLRGMDRCDGIRTTPWGTILVTEETDDGAAYEILDPLGTTEQEVIDRGGAGLPALVSAPERIAKRTALPTMAWEGLAVLPSGVVIGGDELRPGSDPPEAAGPDADGGSIFKFVPAALQTAGGPITRLEDSPLVAGSVHALQVSCVGNRQQYGQGCEVGDAAWIPVNAATARADADRSGATGYYRPEDLHQDPKYRDPENPAAIRVCWANTQNEDAGSFAEVMCAIDGAPDRASATERTVLVTRFIQGDTDFNSFDNLDFQPHTGNLYVIEDHPNGDVFACLPDGADRDLMTDGCVKVISVRDSSAEPTGFIFAPDGTTAYLTIQHSRDDLMPLVDGFRTDDVLKITGFKVRRDHD